MQQISLAWYKAPKSEQRKLCDKLRQHRSEMKREQCSNATTARARLLRSINVSRSKAWTTSGENGLEFGRFGRCAGRNPHQNESATINDLALTTLRFETGPVRNISTELHHVLIWLTRGRAQRLVGALRRCEPISTPPTTNILGA